MSVIGLTVSLTQRLTFTRSRHAVCDITMSRGCDAPPRHSLALSAQNSIQPIGARRRGHPHQDGDNRQSFSLSPELEHCGPRFSCWDHTSHKAFAPRLSTASGIETNTSKTSGYFDLYLNRIRLKFETTTIE